ncbi:ABC transporter ATP-binding protein [Paenibacillus vini]|uniref:Phage protein n=1 Tax=Paenibacillus vini TaxID=1476024 RepID=A0ABQ4MIY9_9BACL|nr:ABC transporter ATP-binding protein [Paenibacillus vini]GIP55955.1 phage protein [Paenibacillus vini]
MDIDYAEYRASLEETYEDRASIKRWEKTKVNGETKLDWALKLADVPCRISQKALASNGQTETVNKITYETKLFISPDIEVLQGDLIEVMRGSQMRMYTAGEPFPYPTHQEISLQRREKA